MNAEGKGSCSDSEVAIFDYMLVGSLSREHINNATKYREHGIVNTKTNTK